MTQLYYFTGKGTEEDLAFAKVLKLVKDQVVNILEIYTIPSTSIIFYRIDTLEKSSSSLNKKKALWFTSRALKPVTP